MDVIGNGFCFRFSQVLRRIIALDVGVTAVFNVDSLSILNAIVANKHSSLVGVGSIEAHPVRTGHIELSFNHVNPSLRSSLCLVKFSRDSPIYSVVLKRTELSAVCRPVGSRLVLIDQRRRNIDITSARYDWCR